MADDLSSRECVPCHGDVDPLDSAEIDDYAAELGAAWDVVEEHHLRRDFEFDDFAEALDFVNAIGAVAEEEGHHPNITFTWGEATVTIYTHAIDGLHENDFILASKIDDVYSEEFA